MAVITISPQYGSRGDDIAARVCEMLGYRYFDKRLMAQVRSWKGGTTGARVPEVKPKVFFCLDADIQRHYTAAGKAGMRRRQRRLVEGKWRNICEPSSH